MLIYYLGIVEPVSTGQAAKDYLTRTVTPTLLKGLTELCKKKPADPIVSSAMLDSEETPPSLFLIYHHSGSHVLRGCCSQSFHVGPDSAPTVYVYSVSFVCNVVNLC